jgi:hypothetical protein
MAQQTVCFPHQNIDQYPDTTVVITRNLRKNDKKGRSQDLPTVIEFTISSFASSDEATSAQMDNAVGQAKESYKHIGPSSLAAVAESAGDAGGVVVDAIPSVNDVLAAWEPLLEKVKLFTEIMDKFAEV